MNPPSITIEGVTIQINDQGIMISEGWLLKQQLTIDDVLKIRDFLNTNYPDDGGK